MRGQVLRSYLLNLCSSARPSPTTTPASRLKATLPDLLIEADPTRERLKITALAFSMPNEAPQVSPSADTDTFSLRNVMNNQVTTYQIPAGTYSMVDLARQFSSVTGGLLTCAYLPSQNKLQWILSNAATPPHTLTLATGLAYIAGMVGNTPYALSGFAPLAGYYTCRPVSTASLFLKLADHSPEAGGLVLSNMGLDGQLRLDDTLAIVPLSGTAPWHWLNWSNAAPDAGGLFSGDTKLSSLELVVTDEEGREMAGMPEWWCQLRVDVVLVREDTTQAELLRGIHQSLRDLLLMKHLKGLP